jgi:hypothetical protein
MGITNPCLGRSDSWIGLPTKTYFCPFMNSSYKRMSVHELVSSMFGTITNRYSSWMGRQKQPRSYSGTCSCTGLDHSWMGNFHVLVLTYQLLERDKKSMIKRYFFYFVLPLSHKNRHHSNDRLSHKNRHQFHIDSDSIKMRRDNFHFRVKIRSFRRNSEQPPALIHNSLKFNEPQRTHQKMFVVCRALVLANIRGRTISFHQISMSSVYFS